MRTIKFRGKRIHDGKWIFGDLIHLDGKVHIYCKDPDYGGSGSWLVDPSTVGQFTGLYDKNGKEIYDGDVCMLYDKEMLQVEFENFIYNKIECIYFEDHMEVIGNIHDNPDLINQDKEI